MTTCEACKSSVSLTGELIFPNKQRAFEDVLRGTKGGCLTCSFMTQVVNAFCSSNSLLMNGICQLSGGDGGFSITWENQSIHLTIFSENVDTKICPFNLVSQKRLPGSTSSDITFGTVKYWISECIASHERCVLSNVNSPKIFPRRLLDLDNVRVVLREGLEPASYACLSHCWGTKAHPLKTTSNTIQAFQPEILWHQLPQTFKDAILICRRLGIMHLWIDSLCIIQDNSKDWEDQAAIMAEIYENAIITIAATRSQDSLQGCFAKTSPRYLASPVPGYDGVYVREQTPRRCEIWSSNRAKTPEWPLLKRGWVYQEMRLSHRVLHFCSEEVMWECRTKRRSESGLGDENWGTDDKYYDSQGYLSWPYWRLERNPRWLWYRSVMEYSGLGLTFETDKLVALSALAKRMEKLRVDDRYIIGLWEKTLLLDLLWKPGYAANFDSAGKVSSVNSDFPSWTWASVQFQVEWDSEDSILPSAHVRHIYYTPIGPSHMGLASEAKIALQAPLIDSRRVLRNVRKAREDPSARHPSRAFRIKEQANCRPDVSCRVDLEVLLDELGVRSYWNDQNVGYQQTYEDDPAVAKGETESYFIPIGFDQRYPDHVSAIQVRKKGGTDEFQRIGYGNVTHAMEYEISLLYADPGKLLDKEYEAAIRGAREAVSGRVNRILTLLPTHTVILV